MLLLHPHLPSCADCHKWMYGSTWRRSEKPTGVPVPRPAHSPTPCQICPKGPKPFAKELSPANNQALWYYQQCKVDKQGLLPVDETTLRNHALIQCVEESVDRAHMAAMSQLSRALATVKG